MLNSEEFYRELGKKAAIARNKRDNDLAQSHTLDFSRALEYEKAIDRARCRQLYNESYTEHRTQPRTEYFK